MSPPPTTDVQKSSGDFLPTEPAKKEEISPVKTEIMPNVEVQETKKKKGSSTLPTKTKKSKEEKLKSEKKSNAFSTFFRHSERKSNVPALHLPAIERSVSPNNRLSGSHQQGTDPFHVPSIDLPKLDLPLPTYDRPEVNMTIGSTKHSSEFSIPVVSFPPIPDLQLPENNQQWMDSNVHTIKVPHVQLPDLQYTSSHDETKNSSHVTKTEERPVQPTSESRPSPTEAILSTQTDQRNFPTETDDAIKTATVVSTLKTQIIEISSNTTDQQITIIDTQLVQSSDVCAK